MQYMLLIYSTDESRPANGSPEQGEEMNAYFAFTQEVLAAG